MTNLEYDKALFRLISILSLIQNGDRPTISLLAQEFNVSTRTIQRDIYQRLNAFPIEKDHDGGLRFTHGYSLSKSKLTFEEMATLSLSVNMVKNTGEMFSKSAQTLFGKFFSSHENNPYSIKPLLSEWIDTDAHLLNTIEKGIVDQKMIKCTVNEDHTIVLEPFKIVNYDGLWYLLAKESVSKRVKNFSIASLTNVKVLKEPFTIDEALKQKISMVHTPYFEDGHNFEVVVKVESCVASFFKRKSYFWSQELVKECTNGDLELKFFATHDEDVDNMIKSWLPHIEVLSPERFKKRIVDELEGYLKKISTAKYKT